MAGIPLPFPLTIQAGGPNSSRQVVTLEDASEVLIDWPHARRGPFYQSAREVVEKAGAGKATPGEALEAFSALCEHAGILLHRKT